MNIPTTVKWRQRLTAKLARRFQESASPAVVRLPDRRFDTTRACHARSATGCIARATRPGGSDSSPARRTVRERLVQPQRRRRRTQRCRRKSHTQRRAIAKSAVAGARCATARHAAFSSTRNSALRARGFAATSAASARCARTIETCRRCGAARYRQAPRQRFALGPSTKGVLHDPVFETVERQHRDATAAAYQFEGRVERQPHFVEFVVDVNSNRLEHARCRVFVRIGSRLRLCDQRGQVSRALDRRFGTSIDDRTRDAASVALLTELTEHRGQFVFARAVDPVRRRIRRWSDPCACRADHRRESSCRARDRRVAVTTRRGPSTRQRHR